MTHITSEQALENIYVSLKNNNEGLDAHILALKIALYAKGTKTIAVDTTKIPEPNRQGRKLMQSYFRKRGIEVTFTAV